VVEVEGIRSDMAFVLCRWMADALPVPAISVPTRAASADPALHGINILMAAQHEMRFTDTPVSPGKDCPVEFSWPPSICRYSLSLFRRVLMLISRSLAACVRLPFTRSSVRKIRSRSISQIETGAAPSEWETVEL